ncbi:MAG: hypothetical protein Q8K69_15180, partial [Bacteroidota bacterium]|nr:hypothetical protein [Bacteroidota bacterium]
LRQAVSEQVKAQAKAKNKVRVSLEMKPGLFFIRLMYKFLQWGGCNIWKLSYLYFENKLKK